MLIKYCFLVGRNTVETKFWLDKHYLEFALGKSNIIDWFAEFECGRMNTNDAPHSGHPKEMVTLENTVKVHKMV